MCLQFSDSYTSLKLIRQKFLRAKIQAIEEKKHRTESDSIELKALKKELKPIESFLSDAKRQRDAILKEIGMIHSCTEISLY